MGRFISGKMSFRNHYMCSAKATSSIKRKIATFSNEKSLHCLIQSEDLAKFIFTSGFTTTHVVVPGHYCNEKFCFEN